jgi:hypothetical protein
MQSRIVRAFLFCLLFLAHSAPLFSQNQRPVSDPQALALAKQAMAALTNGIAVTDVTLTGTATWIAGSDNETGSAALKAKGASESRIDLALSGGPRSEIRANFGGAPQGEWIGPDGNSHPNSAYNCWGDPSWFFLPLSSLASANTNPNLILNYVGAETRNGVAVQHVRSYLYLATQRLARQSSTMDFYLDSRSFLPVAVVFNVHPDNDATVDLPVEVYFSNYLLVSGIQVPSHIQRSLTGSVVLDIVVTGAAINSGLSDSDFKL